MMWPREKIGMAMLILAESVFFFMLIVAFVYFRDESSMKAAGATLNLPITSFYTVSLLVSGIALWRARVEVALLFGGIFLAGQGTEYVLMLRHGVTMSQGLFGTTFFTLTGMHELNGLIGLGLVAALRRSAALTMYWQFIVTTWLAIFGVVYLWSFL